MTICLVASLPGVVVAAADTRITLHHSGDQVNTHDGPEDIHISVASLGRTVVIPYRCRKIRYVGGGWVVVAGEFSSGTLVLDELRQASASKFEEAFEHLRSSQALLETKAQNSTGIEAVQLRETIVLGAALNSGQGVWSLGFSPNDTRTNESVGDYAINFPNDVPAAEKERASREFESELLAAHASQNAIGLVKAAARVIHTAGPFSTSVSSRVQIGVTVADPTGGHVARYFDSTTKEILGFAPANFFPASESAA